MTLKLIEFFFVKQKTQKKYSLKINPIIGESGELLKQMRYKAFYRKLAKILNYKELLKRKISKHYSLIFNEN